MCKRRATPASPPSHPPRVCPSPHRRRRLPAPSALTPHHATRSFPGPTSMRSYYSFKHCSKLQQGGQIPTARGGGRRALRGPSGPPLPGRLPRPLSPHEQRSRGLALHPGAAVPRPPSLEVVPCGASHRCGFPLRPGGVRRLTGTMWLGVVRSRHVPHEGGREEGEEKGGSGGCRGGRQLSFSFFKRLTVIFRVLFSLFPPRWSEWKRRW